jgi:hypothetical protein
MCSLDARSEGSSGRPLGMWSVEERDGPRSRAVLAQRARSCSLDAQGHQPRPIPREREVCRPMCEVKVPAASLQWVENSIGYRRILFP